MVKISIKGNSCQTSSHRSQISTIKFEIASLVLWFSGFKARFPIFVFLHKLQLDRNFVVRKISIYSASAAFVWTLMALCVAPLTLFARSSWSTCGSRWHVWNLFSLDCTPNGTFSVPRNRSPRRSFLSESQHTRKHQFSMSFPLARQKSTSPHSPFRWKHLRTIDSLVFFSRLASYFASDRTKCNGETGARLAT